MKILRFFTGLLIFLPILAGCRSVGVATPDYRERAFRAEVRICQQGMTVYAEVEAERVGEEIALSHVRLLFPPSVAGIEIFYEADAPILVRDGLRMPSYGAEGWWEVASLLCAEGTMRYVCNTEFEGLALEYAEIDDGERTVSVFREKGTGIPKRVTDGTRELTVIRFEPIEARG